MPFFTDTNIPLRYTVIHDKWHEYCERFYLKTDEEIFWSNLVKKEYARKL